MLNQGSDIPTIKREQRPQKLDQHYTIRVIYIDEKVGKDVRVRLFLLCVLTISCLTARAADSLADLQEKALLGDPAAQLELGGKYLFGEGVAEDPEAALKWSKQAAAYAEKNPSWYLRGTAFETVGIAYERVRGGKNVREAIPWYLKSAMLNDPGGMIALSRIYSKGKGVPPDVVLGLAWMYVAAGSGAPGTSGNSGLDLALADLEEKAGPDGVVLARKECDDLTAQIKNQATNAKKWTRPTGN